MATYGFYGAFWGAYYGAWWGPFGVTPPPPPPPPVVVIPYNLRNFVRPYAVRVQQEPPKIRVRIL